MRHALCSSCFVRQYALDSKLAVRNKSTSSAINRGLDATTGYTRKPQYHSSHQSRDDDFQRDTSSSFRIKRDVGRESLDRSSTRFNSWKRNDGSRPTDSVPIRRNRERADSPQNDSHIPLSIPRTTAASHFLYGANVIHAALKAKRRKLYQLYILPRDDIQRNTTVKTGQRSGPDFSNLARTARVPFKLEQSVKLLDRMSGGRPHNGVILEASTIPAPPVASLERIPQRGSNIPLTLDWQSAEDMAVNGAPETISVSTETWRYPLVVMLDGITDPENIGSILRSCHFYGVDAVAVATNTCATLASPVLAKASSGACEAVQLLTLSRPSDFVYKSAQAGWQIYAAVAPLPTRSSSTFDEASKQRTTAAISAESPLSRKPCILMLGSEGSGLRDNLRRRANQFVTIETHKGPSGTPNVGVDSMNVGVAAGVLLEAFLRKPSNPQRNDNVQNGLGW